MASSSTIPTQLAELVQTAHINRAPSPRHDLNPSTAASSKEPAYIVSSTSSFSSSQSKSQSFSSFTTDRRRRRHPYDDLDDLDDDDDDEDIPVSVLVRPRDAPRTYRGGRHQTYPPMPDLRFEQSYLHSIAGADTWWKIAWVTVRDQVMMPLAQGVLYNLAIVGWQHWNRTAQLSGNSVGARIRRWWYGVNNWPLPASARGGRVLRPRK